MKTIGSIEKMIVIVSFLVFAVGAGLMADGKKAYSRQLKSSERVDYKMTLNPY